MLISITLKGTISLIPLEIIRMAKFLQAWVEKTLLTATVAGIMVHPDQQRVALG